MDISAGRGLGSGEDAAILIDKDGGKLLLFSNDGSNGHRTSLFRCDLDGSNCAHADLSSGLPPWSGNHPTPIIDRDGNRLLVVTVNSAGGTQRLALIRCQLDGTGCRAADLPAAGLEGSRATPRRPSAAIDPVGKKLLIAIASSFDSPPLLFRCDLDGLACSKKVLSSEPRLRRSDEVSAVIDEVAKKLLVVTAFQENGDRPSLLRCDLDGSGCVHRDISAGAPGESGYRPSAVLDPSVRRLMIATYGGSSTLFSCAADGTGCKFGDFSLGSEARSRPLAALDPGAKRLLVVDSPADGPPSLYMCRTGDLGCTPKALPAAMGSHSSKAGGIVWEAGTKRLFIATTEKGCDGRLGLFILDSP